MTSNDPNFRIESACLEGAKNVLKILNASKGQADKKALADAQQAMFESSQKLDLIRHSLELVRQDLPLGSSKSQEQNMLSIVFAKSTLSVSIL